MADHLGCDKHAIEGRNRANSRNGKRSKTVLTDSCGEVDIDVPRDRDGSFEPQLVKWPLSATARRFAGGAPGMVVQKFPPHPDHSISIHTAASAGSSTVSSPPCQRGSRATQRTGVGFAGVAKTLTELGCHWETDTTVG